MEASARGVPAASARGADWPSIRSDLARRVRAYIEPPCLPLRHMAQGTFILPGFTKSGPISRRFGRTIRPMGPDSAKFGQISAKVGRIRPKFDHGRPNSVEIERQLAEIWPRSAEIAPKLPESGPNVAGRCADVSQRLCDFLGFRWRTTPLTPSQSRRSFHGGRQRHILDLRYSCQQSLRNEACATSVATTPAAAIVGPRRNREPEPGWRQRVGRRVVRCRSSTRETRTSTCAGPRRARVHGQRARSKKAVGSRRAIRAAQRSRRVRLDLVHVRTLIEPPTPVAKTRGKF